MKVTEIDHLIDIMHHDKEKLFDALSDFQLVTIVIGNSVYNITRERCIKEDYKFNEST